MEMENLKVKIQKIEQVFSEIEKASLAIQKRIEKSEQIEATSEKAAKNSVEKFTALKAPTSSFCYQARDIREDVIEAQKLFKLIKEKLEEETTSESEKSDQISQSVESLTSSHSKTNSPPTKKVAPKLLDLKANYNGSVTSLLDKKSGNRKMSVLERPGDRQRTSSHAHSTNRKSIGEGDLGFCDKGLMNLDVRSLNFVEQMSKYKKNVRVKIIILGKLAKQLANMQF